MALNLTTYQDGSNNSNNTGNKQDNSKPDSGLLSKVGNKVKSALGIGDKTETLSYKKGGTVKKTGLARLHKGEKVLTVKQAKKMKNSKR